VIISNKKVELFCGTGGVGKTTIAIIIAKTIQQDFYTLSAISSGVKDIRDVIEKATELYGFKENSVIDFGDKEADFSKMSIAVFKQPSTITLIQIKNADGTLVKNLKINDFDGTKLTSENFKGVSVNSSFNSIKPGIAVGPQNNFEQSVVVGVFASLAVLAAAIAVIYGCYNGYKKLNQTFSSSNQEEPGGSQGLDIKNIDNKVKNNSNGQAGNIQQGSPQQKKKRGEISLGGNSKF
jgi:hypothetical protein